MPPALAPARLQLPGAHPPTGLGWVQSPEGQPQRSRRGRFPAFPACSFTSPPPLLPPSLDWVSMVILGYAAAFSTFLAFFSLVSSGRGAPFALPAEPHPAASEIGVNKIPPRLRDGGMSKRGQGTAGVGRESLAGQTPRKKASASPGLTLAPPSPTWGSLYRHWLAGDWSCSALRLPGSPQNALRCPGRSKCLTSQSHRCMPPTEKPTGGEAELLPPAGLRCLARGGGGCSRGRTGCSGFCKATGTSLEQAGSAAPQRTAGLSCCLLPGRLWASLVESNRGCRQTQAAAAMQGLSGTGTRGP